MIKIKMWLIAACVVAVSFSANAFAMMSDNNGYINHSQRNSYSDSYMSDFDRGLYNRDNYRVPRSNNGNSINRNNYNSRKYNYNRGYQRKYQEPYTDHNFRGNHNRNINPNGDRYREDHLYQGY